MRDNFTGIFASQRLREILLVEFPIAGSDEAGAFSITEWCPGYISGFVVNKPA
jgi:hypothetical protein